MSTLSQFFGGGGGGGAVKSIQSGTHEGSLDIINISISPVNPAKCVVLTQKASTFPFDQHPRRLGLTATTLTLGPSAHSGSGSGYSPSSFSWQLIEFE